MNVDRPEFDSLTTANAPTDVAPCSPEVCSDPAVRQQVGTVCKENGWPPDKPVVVIWNGVPCFCLCGGGDEKIY